MTPTHRIALALGLGMLFAAAQAPAADPADAKSRQIQDILAKRLPPHMIGPVSPSPVPGLYEMRLESKLVYVSEDGRYIFQGDIFDLESQRNITRARLAELRSAALAEVPEDQMVIYEPKETRYQVTVFTDIDCPYCRKMHSEMADYLKRGIRVRYLFYPRSGKDTPSYDKAVSVWCAKDRIAAMDAAMSGGTLDTNSCANPVADQMALGDRFAIGGTPALVLDNGALIPGYLPPERLLTELKIRE